MFRQKL